MPRREASTKEAFVGDAGRQVTTDVSGAGERAPGKGLMKRTHCDTKGERP